MDLTWKSIAKSIAENQRHNIRHDAAEVARGDIPFKDTVQLGIFLATFQASLDSDEYPDGFSLDEEYGPSESYKTGRSTKSLIVPLPYMVWFPQIIVWCKTLDCLKRLAVTVGT